VVAKPNIKRAFGDRVRDLRVARDWSQETMGAACDLHWTYIGGIERGERNPTLESIYKVAKGLKIEVSELFEDLG
jgi:transcriptional regulator with XRE-family HTH domain